MLKRLDARWTINGTLVVLAFAVAFLGLDTSRTAYYRYATARQLVHVNELANEIISTSAIAATERGITAALLGGDPSARSIGFSSMDLHLSELRTTIDERWCAVQARAAEVSSEPSFAASLAAASAAYDAVLEARRRIDAAWKAETPTVDGAEWLHVMSTFISAMEKVRRNPFLTHHVLGEVGAFNLSLRQWVWQASEYAGRERGTLAYYVGTRQPMPREVLDELHAYRGVVLHSLAEIRSSPQLTTGRPQLRAALEKMEQEFLERYESLRDRLYAEGVTGEYGVSSAYFVQRATVAIDSILSIGEALSQVANEMAAAVERDSLGEMIRYLMLLGVCTGLTVFSLTKVRQTANQLSREKELAEVTLHSIGDAVITTDAEGRIDYLNPIAEELTGWRTEEAAGRPIREVFSIVNGFTREPDSDPVTEALMEGRVVGLAENTVLIRRDGKEFTVEDSAAPIRDSEGQIVGAVMVFYDVSSQRGGAHLMSYHAKHDTLTGLANRREFERRLGELLLSAQRHGQVHSLLYIDLDQFKVVNDTCGHAVGDRLLRQLTYLLRDYVRGSDTLARLGGDEFGLLLENCDLEHARRIADSMRKVIKNFRFIWEDKTFRLSSSIGLVPITPSSAGPAEVLAEADAACYAAKEKGRNRVQVYRPGDLELARRTGEMRWVSRITEALQENRFELYSQLIMPLSPGGLPLHEVLLRLRNPDGELVPPMNFMPAAERYNLMTEIDRWVIHATLESIDRCGCAHPGTASRIFAINLSGASLASPGLLDYIRKQIGRYGVDPGSLCFEVTETAAVANLDQAAEFIKELQRDGCLFALDDFGSGLSSFTYLKHLPVDYLKIDGSFVRDIVDDPVAHSMVEAINTIGHVMEIRTVAEGVENHHILGRLKQMNVDYAQGYGIQRPTPLAGCVGEALAVAGIVPAKIHRG